MPAPGSLPRAHAEFLLPAFSLDPGVKTADPQDFIDMRYVREIEQSGAIDQLYAQTR
jgi:hypothetical protein